MDIFSKIAAGEIPSYKCAENEQFYAFLDINPLMEGHTLVIPRREVDYIFDMNDDELADLEVPHAHIHLLPLKSEADADFKREKLKLPAEQMQSIADKIYAAFKSQQ